MHIFHLFAKITHFLPAFLTSQSNNHTLDTDTLFLVPIQCLGHTDVHKWLVGKLLRALNCRQIVYLLAYWFYLKAQCAYGVLCL